MPRPYYQHIDRKLTRPDVLAKENILFILHDQLNLSAFPDEILHDRPVLLFIESAEKANSLPYHKKKLTYVLSSQRHFAIECAKQGYEVYYHATRGHYDDGLQEIMTEAPQARFHFMTPSEWSTRSRLHQLKKDHPDRFKELPNSFFMADAELWKEKVSTNFVMETFYREMRQQTGYLMDEEGKPAGGQWNYDELNRKKLPKGKKGPQMPQFQPDAITSEVMEMVEEKFPDHFGSTENFSYPVTRMQALDAADHFFQYRLPEFGPYEDAMATGEYTLFHSKLSIHLNNGLLLPGELCNRAESMYMDGLAPIQSVEGFIRQIIGWREYIRIYYEAMMPQVREANHFGFTEALPEMFWTGKTDMKCMQECLKPVIEQGYSHHIPRLMVLSNFSNLTRTNPYQLFLWFWYAYVDAYEWVVLPNVLGMSTYADGGVLASKPYAAGGNYVNKMSDYCKDCSYSISKKTGEQACPFNYLYWNFVGDHRDVFSGSGRISFMTSMWDKKPDDEKHQIRESSRKFLESLKRYEDT